MRDHNGKSQESEHNCYKQNNEEQFYCLCDSPQTHALPSDSGPSTNKAPSVFAGCRIRADFTPDRTAAM